MYLTGIYWDCWDWGCVSLSLKSKLRFRELGFTVILINWAYFEDWYCDSKVAYWLSLMISIFRGCRVLTKISADDFSEESKITW